MTEQSTEIAVRREENFALGRLQPQSVKELAWFAGELVKTGMYTKSVIVNDRPATAPLTGAEAFAVMSLGLEMGVTPLQALDNIYVMVDKRGVTSKIPRADLLAARINADPRTEQWEVDDETQGVVTIYFKRRGRAAGSVAMSLGDIPMRDRNRWEKTFQNAQEMLVNRCTRKVAKRFFRDMVLGLGVADDQEPRTIIDVATVERTVGPAAATGVCEKCNGATRLVANNNGGAFNVCDDCGATSSPTQAVRDTIRGRTEEFVVGDGDGAPTPPSSPPAPAGEVIEGSVEGSPAEVGFASPSVSSTPSDLEAEWSGPVVDENGEAVLPDEEDPSGEGTIGAGAADGPDAAPEVASGGATPPSSLQAGERTRGSLYARMQELVVYGKADAAARRKAMTERGWDGNVRIGDWLKTLDDDALHQVVMAVEALEPQA